MAETEEEKRKQEEQAALQAALATARARGGAPASPDASAGTAPPPPTTHSRRGSTPTGPNPAWSRADLGAGAPPAPDPAPSSPTRPDDTTLPHDRTHERRGGFLGGLFGSRRPDRRPGTPPAPSASSTPDDTPLDITLPEPNPDSGVRVQELINDLESNATVNNGTPAPMREIIRDQNPGISNADLVQETDNSIDQTVEKLISARAAPQGPMISSLRATMTESDFNEVIKRLQLKIARADFTDDEGKTFQKNWYEFSQRRGSGALIGNERPVLTSDEFQQQLGENLTQQTNGAIPSPDSQNIAQRAWSSVANRSFLGKSIGDMVVGAGIGTGVRIIGTALLGSSTGMVAPIAFGAVGGALKGVYFETKSQYNKGVADGTIGKVESINKLAIRDQFKQELRVLNQLNKGKIAKAAVRGAAFGALGGALGNVLGGYLEDNYQVAEKLKGLFPDVTHSSWWPFGTGVTALKDIDGVSHSTSVVVESPKPGVFTDHGGNLIDAPSAADHAGAAGEAAGKATGEAIKVINPAQKLDITLPNGEHFVGTPQDLQDKLAEAAKAAASGGGAEGIKIPEMVVHAGSNPWNETHTLLNQAFGHDISNNDPRIMEITKMISKDSGINVPGWGITGGTIDQHFIPPGTKLVVSDATKKAIEEMVKKG